MSKKDLNLIPTVELWKLADAEPANEHLRQAVNERNRQYLQQRRHNGLESEYKRRLRSYVGY